MLLIIAMIATITPIIPTTIPIALNTIPTVAIELLSGFSFLDLSPITIPMIEAANRGLQQIIETIPKISEAIAFESFCLGAG